MSASFASSSGSGLNLKASKRCSCSPRFRQMLWTLAGNSPTSLAERCALQCATFFWLAQARTDDRPLRCRTDAPPPAAGRAPEFNRPLYHLFRSHAYAEQTNNRRI